MCVVVVEDILAGGLLLVAEVGHVGVRVGRDLILPGEDPVLALQRLAALVFEQPATLRHDVPELVAEFLVHVTPLPDARRLPSRPLGDAVP